MASIAYAPMGSNAQIKIHGLKIKCSVFRFEGLVLLLVRGVGWVMRCKAD